MSLKSLPKPVNTPDTTPLPNPILPADIQRVFKLQQTVVADLRGKAAYYYASADNFYAEYQETGNVETWEIAGEITRKGAAFGLRASRVEALNPLTFMEWYADQQTILYQRGKR